MTTIERLDEITKRLTAFSSFSKLLTAQGGYRPTIRIPHGQSDYLTLADAYDEWQESRNDSRRAFRNHVDERGEWWS